MRALTWRGETQKGEDYAIEEIPADLDDQADEWRVKLLETLAEADDEIMEKYLEGDEFTVEELKAAIRRATIAGKLNPVVCGSAFKNKGVQPMLDAVVDFLPSPLDVPAIEGVLMDGETPVAAARRLDSEPFSGLAFKIQTDKHLGKLTYVRVYSGTLESGLAGDQLHQGPQGADRQDLPDAREQARRAPNRVRRRHHRRAGSQADHHR